MSFHFLTAVAVVLLLSTGPAYAHSGHDHGVTASPGVEQSATVSGEVEVAGAFARATLPKAPVGGVYLTLVNTGAEDDRLVAASSPVAEKLTLHDMKMEGDVMKMSELREGIAIPAGQSVALIPGGLHIMMMGLKHPLAEGSSFPVTLTFERRGEVTIEVVVSGVAADGPAHPMDMSAAHGGMSHDSAPPHGSTTVVDQAGLSDIDAITAMQRAMFDAPGNPLSMGPIVVAGEYAVSDWAQNGTGGRALLRKTSSGWSIHLCAGAGLKDAATLVQIGVPEHEANELAEQLAAAEAALPADQIALYDSFNGTMMVDEGLI